MRTIWLCLAALLLGGAHPLEERAAMKWLARHAVPLASLDPAAPDDDLAPVDAMIGSARIAAFGEATHGSREFFRVKDRLFRHLVRTRGFGTFAIEANFADAERIDDWIKGGPGEAEALVSGLGFWTWDTEEVLALVRWMRAYNAEHGNVLRFAGVDIQHATPNLELALAYLERFDPAGPSPRPIFASFMTAATGSGAGYRAMAAMPAADALRLRSAAEALLQRLESNRDRLVAASGENAYQRARGGAIAAAWYFLMEGPTEERRFRNLALGYDIRDRAMADLAKLALERGGEKSRVFIWAHNAHVGREWFEGDRMTMGFFLARELGADYLAAGFAFDRGSFQAYPPADPARPDFKPGLTRMTVGPAPAGYSEAVLRRAGPTDWMADLRRLRAGEPAYGWFSTARPLRWTGANYSAELMAKHHPISLREQYDLLVFVSRVDRARPSANIIRRMGLTPDW